MKEKVLLDVLLPVTGRHYEFKVPLDLTVEEGAQLAASLIASREPVRYAATSGAGLMYVEGPGAGIELHPLETFRTIVEHGELTNGMRLALV